MKETISILCHGDLFPLRRLRWYFDVKREWQQCPLVSKHGRSASGWEVYPEFCSNTCALQDVDIGH